jgi:hypothetical protein
MSSALMREEPAESPESLETLMVELHRDLDESEMFQGTLVDEYDVKLCDGEAMFYHHGPGGLFEPTSAFLAKDTAARARAIKSHDPHTAPIPIFGVMKCPSSGTLHFHFMTGDNFSEES